jgi:hypothetical protein
VHKRVTAIKHVAEIVNICPPGGSVMIEMEDGNAFQEMGP